MRSQPSTTWPAKSGAYIDGGRNRFRPLTQSFRSRPASSIMHCLVPSFSLSSHGRLTATSALRPCGSESGVTLGDAPSLQRRCRRGKVGNAEATYKVLSLSYPRTTLSKSVMGCMLCYRRYNILHGVQDIFVAMKSTALNVTTSRPRGKARLDSSLCICSTPIRPPHSSPALAGRSLCWEGAADQNGENGRNCSGR